MAVLILAEADPDYYDFNPDDPFNPDEYDLKKAIAIGFDGKFFKY